MPALRRHRRIAHWIALWAVVLGALLPTVSRAMAWASLETFPLGVVCSADASARGEGARGAMQPAGLPHASVFEHCPLCSIHAPDPALPTADASALAMPGQQSSVPEGWLHAPGARPDWPAAQPRAPPAAP